MCMNNYMYFFIQNFKTHHCVMYSGEDHVLVGVLLFSTQAGGHRGEGRVLFTPSSQAWIQDFEMGGEFL